MKKFVIKSQNYNKKKLKFWIIKRDEKNWNSEIKKRKILIIEVKDVEIQSGKFEIKSKLWQKRWMFEIKSNLGGKSWNSEIKSKNLR